LPKLLGFRIKTIHAFIARAADQDEGLAAFRDPVTDTWMPMVAADVSMLNLLRPKALLIAHETQTPIWVARFSVREDIELIEP
jgi:hypothetical protein